MLMILGLSFSLFLSVEQIHSADLWIQTREKESQILPGLWGN